MMLLLIAGTYLSWMPVFSPLGIVALATCSLVVWLMLRFFLGKSTAQLQLGFWIPRTAAIIVLVIIALGPTIVDEQMGAIMRPTMLYLFDGSQSMQLGQEQSRWDESLAFVSSAQANAGSTHGSDFEAFRFGHRLQPLQHTTDERQQGDAASLTMTSGAQTGNVDKSLAPPTASDSRLSDALRQLLPQVNAKQTAGVVLLSDGRVRASESVERLAEYFGESGVPIHVVPIGRASGSGDVAIVSLVVPPRVRKYTENELQVFLRSFGFNGQRTTVRILSRNKISNEQSSSVASVPITLTGGAQSVSLTFRVNEQAEDYVVVVDPVQGELTERNNRVDARVDIDRTKVRVLYIESEVSTAQQGLLGRLLSLGESASGTSRNTALTVQSALQSDEDVQCTLLVSAGGAAPRTVSADNPYGTTGGFPRSRAELFAYDCVVLSNVGPNVLDQEQVQWLSQWIEGRGGGFVVTGSGALSPTDWQDSPLLPLLPVSLDESQLAFAQATKVDIAEPLHPVWRLRLEQRLNGQLLDALPNLSVSRGKVEAKPTSDVLVKRSDDGSSVMVTHRVGRGRVLVSTAALGGRALIDLADNWGPQPEQVAAKLWRNIVYWATEGSSTGRRRLVAETDKRFYRPGEPLSVIASAYDEAARRTNKYRVWAMFEPASLDEASLYSPLLWPEGVARESGEVSPRLAWGEELLLAPDLSGDGYRLNLLLSETGGAGDSGMRIEMTAYEGDESSSAFDHGTQVDSTSLAIHILSDPFEQQNPLPNHELMQRLASLSGGQVLDSPGQLAKLLADRPQARGAPTRDVSPAWSKWWLWLALLGLLSGEWIWRKLSGYA